MLNFHKIAYLLAFLFLYSLSPVHAQETDNNYRTVMSKPKKNIIKINLTSGLLYDLPLLFEYERVLGSHRSVSIQLGYSKLPLETNLDSLRWTSGIKSSGYNATIDYRFYLRKENKDPAPHGIYLAPFFSYYHFANDRDLEFETDSSFVPLNVKAKYNIISLGGALGYQFTLGKRWVIDCLLLGPSLGYYHVEMNLTGDIPEKERGEIAQNILESLAERFPFANKLFEEKIADFSGTSSSWNYGFRYSIHLGYRF